MRRRAGRRRRVLRIWMCLFEGGMEWDGVIDVRFHVAFQRSWSLFVIQDRGLSSIIDG